MIPGMREFDKIKATNFFGISIISNHITSKALISNHETITIYFSHAFTNHVFSFLLAVSHDKIKTCKLTSVSVFNFFIVLSEMFS